MVDIQRFVLHVVKTKHDDKTKTDMIVKSKEIPITPKDKLNTMRMKEAVAEKLRRERDRDAWTYWYLTMQIDGPDGQPRFRTIVGKTFFAGQ
jgi:hypothetical protein